MDVTYLRKTHTAPNRSSHHTHSLEPTTGNPTCEGRTHTTRAHARTHMHTRTTCTHAHTHTDRQTDARRFSSQAGRQVCTTQALQAGHALALPLVVEHMRDFGGADVFATHTLVDADTRHTCGRCRWCCAHNRERCRVDSAGIQGPAYNA
jgi:hypothetical protein